MHLHFTWFSMPGFEQKMVSSRIEIDNGAQAAITDIVSGIEFDPRNRRLPAGELDCTLVDDPWM